jgi:glycosyltransferase involved in cell wall biosynthesis
MNDIDVIVPCYRYGHFLRECVLSILNQEDTSVRVLIIDDASPDNTEEVAQELIKEDSRVNFIKHFKNKGHIATYNEGIDWASAKYQLLLSADDYLLPGSLKSSAELMDRFPEVGFTYGKALRVQNNNKAQQVPYDVTFKDESSFQILKGFDFIELCGAHNIVPTPTAVVRTELLKSLGCGYRPELPHSGDMEMWFRLAAHSSVGFIDRYQAVYRIHENNMSKEYLINNWIPDIEQRKAAIDVFLLTCQNSTNFPKKIKKKLTYDLSKNATSLASSAFNLNDMASFNILKNHALKIYPDIKLTVNWLKILIKERLGFENWHKIHKILNFLKK